MARPPEGSIPLPGLLWRGLNLQFFALFFLPLIGVLLLITFGSLTLHQRAMRQLVGERDERAARTAASALGEQLYHRAAAVRGLALRSSDQNFLEDSLESSNFLQDDFDYGMAFYSPQGEFLASAGDITAWEKLSGELSSTLDNAVANAGEETVFSLPLFHSTDDECLVFVAFAVDIDSPVAVGAFSPVSLARRTLAGAFTPGEGAAAFVVAQDNHVY